MYMCVLFKFVCLLFRCYCERSTEGLWLCIASWIRKWRLTGFSMFFPVVVKTLQSEMTGSCQHRHVAFWLKTSESYRTFLAYFVPISAGPSLDSAVMCTVYAVSEWLPTGRSFSAVISVRTLKSNSVLTIGSGNWTGSGMGMGIVRFNVPLDTF